MAVRHCTGCDGYVHGWTTDCRGLTMGEFETPDVVPPMRVLDRLRALIGLPVFLGTGPDPLDVPDADTAIFVPQDWDS
jgi:hypothetical protein